MDGFPPRKGDDCRTDPTSRCCFRQYLKSLAYRSFPLLRHAKQRHSESQSLRAPARLPERSQFACSTEEMIKPHRLNLMAMVSPSTKPVGLCNRTCYATLKFLLRNLAQASKV